MSTRRSILSNTLAAATGAAVAACGGADADAPLRRPFVLVHGAWHGSWCWSEVARRLSQWGHPVVALDLPGHGLNARFPASYRVFPRPDTFATEPSPVAAITLTDYQQAVSAAVEALLTAGLPAPVVVGHSMGGVAIQAAAEALGPGKVHHLVYVAAFMPANGMPLLAYIQDATASESLVFPLLRADPQAVGAMRLDPDAMDPAYQDALAAAFYGGVAPDTVAAARNLLTPDVPVQPFVAPLSTTSASWGRVSRTYVRTIQDRAVTPPMQDLMISQADAASPGNKTVVVSLDTGHSPFFSKVEELVVVLRARA